MRAYTADPARSEGLLGEALGFEQAARGRWEVRGESRERLLRLRRRPGGNHPRQGAGTVHHVAFASQPEDQEAWRERVARGGRPPDRR